MSARRVGRRRPVKVVTHGRSRAAGVDGHVAPSLTGAFDTAQLPRIAGDPVTVTVARTVAPGYEAAFLAWADELVAEARKAQGCLGAAVFHPGPGGGDYQIVVRFTDGMHLRQWERSDVRNELMARADGFVTGSRMQRTVGVEEWFAAASHAPVKRPKWRGLLSDVAWVYPLSMMMTLFIAPFINRFPVWARVLFGASVITLAMSFAVGPMRRRLRSRRRL